MKEETRQKKEYKFIQKIQKIFGDKYDTKYVHYIDRSTPVKLYCNICGNFFEKTPDILRHGCGCPNCSKDRMKALGKTKAETTKHFIEKSKSIHGDKFDYSNSIYVNYNTPVLIHCNTCGKNFYQKPSYHYYIKDCPFCLKEKRQNEQKNIVLKYTTKEAIEMIRNVHGDKYGYDKVIYKGRNKKVTLFCKECNQYVDVIFSSLLKGSGCPICARKRQRKKLIMSNEEFIRRSKKLFGNNTYNYDLCNYDGYYSKVMLKCNIHNRVFEQTAGSHLSGCCGCPSCINHLTENKIDHLLKLYNIKFDRETTFPWLIYKSYMRLDFYLSEYNIAIEYQGEQHFYPINFNGVSEDVMLNDFEESQKRDILKKQLCKDHGIEICYISYDEKIDESLFNILLKIGAIHKSTNMITLNNIQTVYNNSDNNLKHNISPVPIVQYDLNKNVIAEYSSIYEISDMLGIPFTNLEFRTIINKNKPYYGYIWKLKSKHYIYKICKYDKNGNFISNYSTIKNAASETNTSYHGIKSCLHDEQQSSGGYIWKAEYVKKERKRKNYPLPSYKQVLQYDINNNLINEYDSIADAARYILRERHSELVLKHVTKRISACLNGKNKTAYKYIWKFKL